MTEVVGAGVIKLSADATGVTAGVNDAKKRLADLGDEVAKTAKQGSAKAIKSIDEYIKKVELSSTRVGLSFGEQKLFELRDRGATAEQLSRAGVALGVIQAEKDRKAAILATGVASNQVAQQIVRDQLAATKATNRTFFQQQQLGFQLNDFFVQIASGQNPLTAFIQQGSQLSGTFGGAGNAFKAVTALLTPLRIAIGGGAAALLAIGAAWNAGVEESKAFLRSTILTGNAAGITEGAYRSLSASIAETSKTTIGSSKATVQALISTGQVTRQALGQAGLSVQLLAKLTGESTDKLVAKFAEGAQAPGRFAQELDKTYNFLSAARLKEIKELEQQGDKQRAFAEVLGALNPRLRQAAGEVGILQKAYSKLKDTISAVIDASLAIGREITPQDQLATIDAVLAKRLEAGAPRKGVFNSQENFDKQTEAIKRNREEVLKLVDANEKDAAAQAASTARKRAGNAIDEIIEKTLSKQLILRRELKNANALADKEQSSPERRKQLLSAVYEQFKDPAAGAQAEAVRKARLDADLQSAEDRADILQKYAQRETQILDANHAAQLVSDRAFYDAKRAFLVDQIRAEETALLEQQARLQSELGNKSIKGATRVDLLKKEAELETKIIIARAEASAKTAVLDINEEARREKVTQAIEEQRRQLQDYLGVLERAQALDNAVFGRGNQAAAQLRGQAQIEDRFISQRAQIKKDLANNPNRAEQFEAELQALESAKNRELQIFESANARALENQANWLNGMTASLENYVENARNIAAQTEGMFDRAFQGMEDALVDFVVKGKADFKSLAQSIIADIVRIYIKQQLLTVAKFFAGAVGAGSSPMGAAGGGILDAGTPLFSSPTIGKQSAPALGKGGVTVNVVQNTRIESGNRNQIQADIARANAQNRAGIVDAVRRGTLNLSPA